MDYYFFDTQYPYSIYVHRHNEDKELAKESGSLTGKNIIFKNSMFNYFVGAIYSNCLFGCLVAVAFFK